MLPLHSVDLLDWEVYIIDGAYPIEYPTTDMYKVGNKGLCSSFYELAFDGRVVDKKYGYNCHGDNEVISKNISLNSSFTIKIVFWHTYTSTSAWEWLATIGEDGNNFPFVVSTQANKIRCSLGAWFTDIVTSTTQILNNGYNQAIITRDEFGNCKVYVNKVSDGISQNCPTEITDLPLWIGKKVTDYYKGNIPVFDILNDEVYLLEDVEKDYEKAKTTLAKEGIILP